MNTELLLHPGGDGVVSALLSAPDGSPHSVVPPLYYVSKSMGGDAVGAERAFEIACGADSGVHQKQVDDWLWYSSPTQF